MRHPGTLAILCACLIGTGALGATVPVQISSISGRSIYLDKGRGSGLSVGMKVRLLPPGADAVDLIVSAVSTNSARVDVPEGVVIPDVGVAGEVEVPDDAAQPAPDTQPKRPEKPPVPEHPPWQGKVASVRRTSHCWRPPTRALPTSVPGSSTGASSPSCTTPTTSPGTPATTTT